MSELVPPEEIEGIVGAERHPFLHIGRAVSAEGRTYILHSQLCVNSGRDLRDCSYSKALDRGVRQRDLIEDAPVHLIIYGGRLVTKGRIHG